jgi:hypothetical protein
MKDADIKEFIEKKDEKSVAVKKIKMEERVTEEVIACATKISQKPKDELELEDFTPISRNFKFESVAVTVDSVVHSMSALTSKDSITLFIKNETNYRKVDSQKSLTISKMKKKVWKEFRDDIKNKSVLMQDGAFINYVNDYLEEYKIG